MSIFIQNSVAVAFILFLEGLEYRYILINLHTNKKVVLETTDYSLHTPHQMKVAPVPQARTISTGQCFLKLNILHFNPLY